MMPFNRNNKCKKIPCLFNFQAVSVLLLLVFLLLNTHTSQAQGNKELAKQLIEIANEAYYELQAIEVAKEQYVAAAQADPENIEANFMAGKTIMETVNKGEAVPYFLAVNDLDANYRFDIMYLIARAYQYNYEFGKAIQYYNKYKEKMSRNPNYRGQDKVVASVVDRRIYESNNGKEFTENPTSYTIVNIGSQVNSNYPDYAPVLNEDETIMIFTSRRREGNSNEDVYDDNFPYEEIYFTRKVGGKWSRAENIGESVNTLYFESNLALSADGDQLYIYRDENSGDIYVSERVGDTTWSVPEPISRSINSSFSESSVSISPDGQYLYFASDRPGGKGGIDIYRCQKDRKGNWGKVENLGDVINTPYDEDGPFIDYDGKTLYFSSRGGKGMGGYDIFKSEYDSVSNTWSEPENLGAPINTPDDDVYFVSTKDGKRGYYASVRGDGKGYLDIYMVQIPDLSENTRQVASRKNKMKSEGKSGVNKNMENVANSNDKEAVADGSVMPVQLFLKVEDTDSEEPLNAEVKMVDKSQNEVRPKKIGTGIYRFNITSEEDQLYTLEINRPGYVYRSVKVEIPAASAEAKEFRRIVDIDKIETNYVRTLEFVYFRSNSTRLAEESYQELDQLENFLRKNEGMRIEIAGHTDNQGSARYNKMLSQKRAQAVVDYLINKGIQPARLEAKGYGESQPIASNDDEEDGRELNRRVEMRILASDQALNR